MSRMSDVDHRKKNPIMRQSHKNKQALAALAALALSLMAAPAEEETLEWPAAEDAVFAQRDANNLSPVVAFDTRGRSLMAFSAAMRGRAIPGRFHELICDGGSFHALDAGAWVGAQVAESGEFTLEVTMTPAVADPEAPGVIFAFGNDDGQDFALRQEKDGLSLALGEAGPIGLFAPEAGAAVHVLIACGSETWTAYRDGEQAATGDMPADLPTWEPRELVMGANWAGEHPWRGRLEMIAVFPRVLTAEEAATQARASAAMRADREPATTVHFKGTLARQAETSKLEEIRPYTRSLSFAEYKVDEVLEGEWEEPTIMVAHWMIMDAERLPIADREPGTEVELRVELMEQHSQLESSRRDELQDADLDAVPFYAEFDSAP